MSHELDLHGIRHQDVDMMVENFVLMNQDSFPLTLICGNSIRMINIAEDALKRIGCETASLRYGVIIVRKFK